MSDAFSHLPSSQADSARTWHGTWVWPLPRLSSDPHDHGAAPIIAREFHEGWGRPPDHTGVDLRHERCTPPEGFSAPIDVPVLAAADGVLESIMQTPRGWCITMRHPVWYFDRTIYRDVESVCRGLRSGDQVWAGQVLGVLGRGRADGHQARHLHFEVRCDRTLRCDSTLGEGAVDPVPAMKAWPMILAVRRMENEVANWVFSTGLLYPPSGVWYSR